MALSAAVQTDSLVQVAFGTAEDDLEQSLALLEVYLPTFLLDCRNGFLSGQFDELVLEGSY